MGILKRRHLSAQGHVVASTLRVHVENEAELLDMAANRLNAGAPPELREDPEFLEIVSYLGDAARRLRALVEDL